MLNFDNLEFDLGEIKYGIVKTVDVNVTNDTSSVVSLTPANASCSCTTGYMDYTTLQPKSKGVFKISLNTSKSGKGKQARSIALNYSIDRKSFSQIFRIKANVV